MDLEQMQQVWSKMDNELQKQKKMTDKLILQMTQEKYAGKFRKLANIETLGGVVCLVCALFLILNFNKLDTWYLMLCGAIVIGYLVLMPILVLRPLYKIKNIQIDKNSLTETITNFLKTKELLLKLQRIGMYFNILLLLLILPVTNKMFNDKDMFTTLEDTSLYIVLGVVFIFTIWFSKWGYNRYKNITNSAENILNDLDLD